MGPRQLLTRVLTMAARRIFSRHASRPLKELYLVETGVFSTSPVSDAVGFLKVDGLKLGIDFLLTWDFLANSEYIRH